jgi:hypothetical protein
LLHHIALTRTYQLFHKNNNIYQGWWKFGKWKHSTDNAVKGVIVMKFAKRTLSESDNPDDVSRDIGACLDIAATVGLRHCDIRLNNVLLFNDVWQLCDWGLCALPGEEKALVFKDGEQGKCAGSRIRGILDKAKGDRVSVEWICDDDKGMLNVVLSTCKSYHAFVPHALSVLNLRNERALTCVY